MNTVIQQEKLTRKDKLVQKMITEEIYKTIKEADKVLIGGGAGLSAGAGLDYGNGEIFKKNYSLFYERGYQSIWDAITDHWTVNKENARTYWAFWATHINYVYHEQDFLETYQLLYNLVKDKDYFVITTNGDDQFYKGSFDPDKVFSMQGSYSKFQCQKGCHNKLYDNKEMVKKMLDGLDPDTLMIREEDIPVCPDCGELLCPNLRIDQYFVDEPYMHKQDAYVDFASAENERIVFLEIGVGYNTPVIIRYPFEKMTNAYSNATLIRVNKSNLEETFVSKDKMIATTRDIHDLLIDLNQM